jgi:hypothetical protein
MTILTNLIRPAKHTRITYQIRGAREETFRRSVYQTLWRAKDVVVQRMI